MSVRTDLYLISLLSIFLSSTAAATNGTSVYEQNCKVCHGEGIAGAPRSGEIDVWKERLPKGIDAMVTIVIEGVQGYSGAMPPRGGNPNLSDDQIREAVQYMLDQLQ
jgi:cytochrome c